MARPIYEIAKEIQREFGKAPVGNKTNFRHFARPYLLAMFQLSSINDTYGHDTGRSIVNYFLTNVAGWRGPTARRIKAELNDLLRSTVSLSKS